MAIPVVAAFGLLVEGIQFGVPWLAFAPADAVGNTLGALAVAAAWRLLGIGRRLEPIAGDSSPTDVTLDRKQVRGQRTSLPPRFQQW